MTVEDVPYVAALDETIFEDPQVTIEDRIVRFEEELARPFAVVLVAEQEMTVEALERNEDNIVGYLLAWSTFDEAHLLNIAVSEPSRRKGIAKQLLDAFLTHEKFRDLHLVVLEVRVSNEAAKKFYEKEGFVLSRTRRSYYPDGEDALELVRARSEGDA